MTSEKLWETVIGFSTPDKRYEPGDDVHLTDLPASSRKWLAEAGVIVQKGGSDELPARNEG